MLKMYKFEIIILSGMFLAGLSNSAFHQKWYLISVILFMAAFSLFDLMLEVKHHGK